MGTWGTAEAEDPGEGVTVSICSFLSLPLPVSDPGISHPCVSSLGLLGSGLAGAEREVVVNMLNSLSRNQPLPQIASRCGCLDPLPGRLPYQGYQSACSGRHYCLRGLDCYSIGGPCTERRHRPLCPELPSVRFAGLSLPASAGLRPQTSLAAESG